MHISSSSSISSSSMRQGPQVLEDFFTVGGGLVVGGVYCLVMYAFLHAPANMLRKLPGNVWMAKGYCWCSLSHIFCGIHTVLYCTVLMSE